ncbi:S24 family peptidase, partial [Lamprobacter modestohalophilus]|uniref:LexA family protein n=1 Tax=Lamprobacter modestohalophilus TaxID=1064514 RepID=UPI002ADEB149
DRNDGRRDTPPNNRLREISPRPGRFARDPIDQGRALRLAAAALLQPTTYLAQRAQFALRVQGDSMTEDQIEDGDLILIAPQATAANGEIVVALIDGEAATVKRLYRETNGVRLQPAHAAMPPLHYPAEAVQLIGLVTAVLRERPSDLPSDAR